MAKIAINGFGRIGRNAFKVAMEQGVDIVAINDLTDANTLAHLLKYDSCFGRFEGTVEVGNGTLVVNGKEIKVLAERNPADLPWKELGVDIVIESTGLFRQKEKAQLHIDAGAKKVIISAPGKGTKSIVMGVNEEDYNPAEDNIIDNASCTTNCLAPFAKVLNDTFGIKRGIMTTVHSYTNDQRILDLPHEDLRRARAAAESIIPTTTGAAEAVAKVIPSLKGKLTGMAMRVPSPTVSVVDLTVELGKEVTVEEVNGALKAASEGSNVLGYSDEPLVSIDYRKDSRSSIVDGLATLVMEGSLVKVVSWYDNEWGYSNRIIDLAKYVAERL
ncbi:type I glyceraldehyde-3-phosphate dehydrogenase [Vallitalea sp.]|jgi:glyceraldehyde 3-phosphate dehydrogenase|uniref:type I glyceraldehyde-3-phosphate dehydrogenase n=1 Tax=Vallitalea sp. TaxID=1882829 RepID=UPI0025F07774|nr:type I glyceraldehyde-3-phosphate dehydrogenase [Vallitalea sp.]MCT4685944.1 type I glyceraldehyde-3-phosphate dehydrogenase [Vallitalea sp.]